jgi:hypothetical protein
MRTLGAGQAHHLRVALVLAMAGIILSGCGGDIGSIFGKEFKEEPLPTIGDRFNQIFGWGLPSDEVSLGEGNVPCPPVKIRAGASTYAVAAQGKQPVGNDMRYQVTITRTARDCKLEGDQIAARIGIQGRVIAGPAGNPPSVEIPLRVAVVRGGVQERTIATKVYRTTVPFTEGGSVPFSLVAEDLEYPAPPSSIADSFIFYIGFDPQALTPEPARTARRKK